MILKLIFFTISSSLVAMEKTEECSLQLLNLPLEIQSKILKKLCNFENPHISGSCIKAVRKTCKDLQALVDDENIFKKMNEHNSSHLLNVLYLHENPKAKEWLTKFKKSTFAKSVAYVALLKNITFRTTPLSNRITGKLMGFSGLNNETKFVDYVSNKSMLFFSNQIGKFHGTSIHLGSLYCINNEGELDTSFGTKGTINVDIDLDDNFVKIIAVGFNPTTESIVVLSHHRQGKQSLLKYTKNNAAYSPHIISNELYAYNHTNLLTINTHGAIQIHTPACYINIIENESSEWKDYSDTFVKGQLQPDNHLLSLTVKSPCVRQNNTNTYCINSTSRSFEQVKFTKFHRSSPTRSVFNDPRTKERVLAFISPQDEKSGYLEQIIFKPTCGKPIQKECPIEKSEL